MCVINDTFGNTRYFCEYCRNWILKNNYTKKIMEPQKRYKPSPYFCYFQKFNSYNTSKKILWINLCKVVWPRLINGVAMMFLKKNWYLFQPHEKYTHNFRNKEIICPLNRITPEVTEYWKKLIKKCIPQEIIAIKKIFWNSIFKRLIPTLILIEYPIHIWYFNACFVWLHAFRNKQLLV